MVIGGSRTAREEVGLVGFWCPGCRSVAVMRATRLLDKPWGASRVLSKPQLRSVVLVCQKCNVRIGLRDDPFSGGVAQFNGPAYELIDKTCNNAEVWNEIKELNDLAKNSDINRVRYFSKVLQLVDNARDGVTTNSIGIGMTLSVISFFIAIGWFAIAREQQMNTGEGSQATYAGGVLVVLVIIIVREMWKMASGDRRARDNSILRCLTPLQPDLQELEQATKMASSIKEHRQIRNWFNEKLMSECSMTGSLANS